MLATWTTRSRPGDDDVEADLARRGDRVRFAQFENVLPP
jgi:hypothetical protein